ncbi:hypothetical protein V490_09324 [Pseudogymnoascus sp. VKM F-3557]|nr:hypothetical protein V490_09324 [Pseudogymnoascus sp. VKM F-3557]
MANDFDADFFIDPDSPGLFVNQLGECDGLFGFDAVDDVSAASTTPKGSVDYGSGGVHRASDDDGADGASVGNGVGTASISETVHADDASEDDDGDDGLYGDQASRSVDEDDDEEDYFEEEDPPAGADDPLSWRVDHSTGDHKLKAKNFIAKTESAGFDGPQALEMIHRLYTMDYGSRRSGSKAADVEDEYHPLFFLDYICIVGRPLQPITRRNERFFDNVTVTFKDWQEPYTAKVQYKLPFDIQNRTFRLAVASSREKWFVVMHPIMLPAVELLSSRQERLKKQARSSQLSALTPHHARVLASYIKDVFQTGELMGERVEPSWTLNSPLSQTLTGDTWTIFQERFMEEWPLLVEQHSYDPFWAENQPAFHAYDYGANIEIKVSERLASLEKETRLRTDDDAAADSRGDSDSGSSSEGDDEGLGRGADTTTRGRRGMDREDWRLSDNSPDSPDSLYSDGLRDLMTELDSKYDLENVSSISYALAVDLHCLDSRSPDPESQPAYCMLADRNRVRDEYAKSSGVSGLTFYPMALHPAYGNFTSAGPPRFLKDHVLAVMKDNMSYQNDGADVLSCEYFQAYSNIKRSIRYNPEDLLVTQGTATAALTVPDHEADGSVTVKNKQQRLLRRLRGDSTPDEPDASRPFARERQRIQQAMAEEQFAYRMEQVVNIDVGRLVPARRNLRTVLRPIFQLMRFYLQETTHYTHILRCFRPAVFPQILGSFARVFELAMDEMLKRGRGGTGSARALLLHGVVAGADELGVGTAEDDGKPAARSMAVHRSADAGSSSRRRHDGYRAVATGQGWAASLHARCVPVAPLWARGGGKQTQHALVPRPRREAGGRAGGGDEVPGECLPRPLDSTDGGICQPSASA